MKNWIVKKTGSLKKYYEILYSAALCVGLILIADSLFTIPYRTVFFLLSSLFWQFFIYTTEEKNLRFPLWSGMGILLVLFYLFLYAGDKNLIPYFYFLGLTAICIPLSILCYLAGRRLWLKSLLCLSQLICLIVFSIQKISLSKWAVCLILFCFLIFLAELSCAFSEGKAGQKILYLTPFFFLAMLLMLLLPVKETPIRWHAVKSVVKAVREELTALIINAEYYFSGGSGSYSLNFAGYDEDNGIGGRVLSSDSPQLSIIGDQTKAPLYLAGTIRDFYNGHEWELRAADKSYEGEEYLLQYDGLMSSLTQSIYSQKDIEELVSYSYYDVTYKGLKTKSLFFAPFTQNVLLFNDKPTAFSYGDGLRLSKAQGMGFRYQLHLMELNYSDERVKQLLRGQAWNGTPFLTETAAERQRFVHEHYTFLPDTLPSRVYSLAEEITSEADNDYDRMKAIEDYLSEYTYTTSPRPLPEEADVVDEFLFESKNGYCTYFASAMAVLGRCEGIPTRYVEGFVSNSSYHYDNRVLNLSGNNAHAWVEAYIDNIGWIPYDPTPRYYVVANTAWQQNGEVTAASITPPAVPYTESSAAFEEEEISEISNSSVLESGKKLLFFIVEGLLLICIVSFMIFLFLLLRNQLLHRRYMAGNDYEKIQFHMKKAFLFGRLHGYPIEAGETLLDYGARTEGSLDTSEYSFLEICDLFQSIRFGGRPISEMNIKVMEAYTLSLQKKYLKQCGRMKRLLYFVMPVA